MGQLQAHPFHLPAVQPGSVVQPHCTSLSFLPQGAGRFLREGVMRGMRIRSHALPSRGAECIQGVGKYCPCSNLLFGLYPQDLEGGCECWFSILQAGRHGGGHLLFSLCKCLCSKVDCRETKDTCLQLALCVCLEIDMAHLNLTVKIPTRHCVRTIASSHSDDL